MWLPAVHLLSLPQNEFFSCFTIIPSRFRYNILQTRWLWRDGNREGNGEGKVTLTRWFGKRIYTTWQIYLHYLANIPTLSCAHICNSERIGRRLRAFFGECVTEYKVAEVRKGILYKLPSKGG
jgi:hypothetical protein